MGFDVRVTGADRVDVEAEESHRANTAQAAIEAGLLGLEQRRRIRVERRTQNAARLVIPIGTNVAAIAERREPVEVAPVAVGQIAGDVATMGPAELLTNDKAMAQGQPA